MSKGEVQGTNSNVESRTNGAQLAIINPQHLSPNQRAWRRFLRNRPAVFSSFFLGIMISLILIWPLLSKPKIAPHLPKGMAQSAIEFSGNQFSPPNSANWLGTDVHGRDLLSRIFHGAKISLLVGLVGASVSLVIGVLWGAIAGYVGGRWDGVMMRFVDVLYALPSIIFVIVLITAVNGVLEKMQTKGLSAERVQTAKFLVLFVGLGAVSWLTMARIVRGQVLSLRTRNFVDASRALGASHSRILLQHILPNVYGIIIVYLTLTVPSIILYESFLSYLGLGIPAPQASLGTLIATGVDQINSVRIYWWLIVFPGAMLATMLLALNFIGDGLRDAFDPRGKS